MDRSQGAIPIPKLGQHRNGATLCQDPSGQILRPVPTSDLSTEAAICTSNRFSNRTASVLKVPTNESHPCTVPLLRFDLQPFTVWPFVIFGLFLKHPKKQPDATKTLSKQKSSTIVDRFISYSIVLNLKLCHRFHFGHVCCCSDTV